MKTEIRKLLGSDKLVLGTDRVLKSIRAGKVEKVVLASNVPEDLKTELAHYQKLSGFALEDAGVTNEELGTMCKKQFSVAAIAILK